MVDAAEANHSILANHLVVDNIEADSPEGERVRSEVAALIEQHKRSEFYARGIVLGYCYQKSHLIVDDGSQAEWKSSIHYTPSAILGCRAPHFWLEDNSSLYDHFGTGFTLLVSKEKHEGDILAAEREAEMLKVPLKILYLPKAELGRLYEAPMVLIRPDQHVAWWGNSWLKDEILGASAGHSN